MEITNLVDAGPLIGWLNASDQWHPWAVETLSAVRSTRPRSSSARRAGISAVIPSPAMPCWGSSGRALSKWSTPWPGHLERTQELMMKYERMDAADASLVMLSEIHRNAKMITTDRRDFTLYRRFGRQRLPVILPPG